MKHLAFAILAIVLGWAGIAYALARLRSELGIEPFPQQPPIIVESINSHIATAEMRSAARSMESREAPAFQAEADDGKSYSLRDLAGEGPLALIFIKDGCPCSVAAAPYFNRLRDDYGDRVRFFGIIDGDPPVARRWAKAHQPRFPLLSDPRLDLVHEYKVENSAYLALVARGGTIVKCWPGYSVGMLEEANAELARLAGVEAKPVNSTGAPIEMYTGCPY
ncbi:peroxiredoxin family protein [Aquisphaera insulae]|uniref:peroxiredoxin family protein n=1 Tax=Aquisphaera insulae TaxID=2712864 RepID=UPI0013EBD09D|nr:redoxin domain-containing protein [Aquisphaera insulae]